MSNSYYNTTNQSGIALQQSQAAAVTQEELILWHFQQRPNVELTPWEVSSLLKDHPPITSVRRAISNLTQANKLQKTDTKKDGPYGKPSYCWRLK
jgi:dihydrodipicolinate synthase/N-acetylneuraminate lyase